MREKNGLLGKHFIMDANLHLRRVSVASSEDRQERKHAMKRAQNDSAGNRFAPDDAMMITNYKSLAIRKKYLTKSRY